jgi:hypothetical protein
MKEEFHEKQFQSTTPEIINLAPGGWVLAENEHRLGNGRNKTACGKQKRASYSPVVIRISRFMDRDGSPTLSPVVCRY